MLFNLPDPPLSWENRPRKVNDSFTVLPSQAGLRLDKVLAKQFPEFSRTRFQELIATGYIRSNKVSLKDPAYKVQEGHIIDVTIPPLVTPSPLPQDIPLSILFEDGDIIVLNKPAGMVTHPAPGHPEGTLVNALLYHCGTSLSGINGVRRPGIVHRLDKDTSGLMVVAKNDRAHQHLSEQLSTREMKRVYQAVVWGMLSAQIEVIEGAIGRDPNHRQRMSITEDGRFARTHCHPLKFFRRLASLVDCRLDTGRTHQIRVHLSSKGHGLIGDGLYGHPPRFIPAPLQDFLRETWIQKRQALHAKELSLIHPTTGEAMHFQSDLPMDIRSLLDVLQSLA